MSVAFTREKGGIKGDGAFTVVELLAASAVAMIVVTAGIFLMQAIHRASKSEIDRNTLLSVADEAIEQINEEISSGNSVLAAQSEVKAGCVVGSGTFAFGIELPAQAFVLSDYGKDISPSTNAVSDCPVIFGVRRALSNENGPFVLYRLGPAIDEKGFYIKTNVVPARETVIVEGLSSSVRKARVCPQGWIRLQNMGFEACVDQYKRTGKVSFSLEGNSSSSMLARNVKRSGGATTRIFNPALVPTSAGGGGSSSGSKCRTGASCSWFGQPITCDKTTFVIDTSGSMQINGRMGRAISELMNAINQCSDDAEINVMAFSSTSRNFWSTPQRLSQQNRSSVLGFVRGLYASGGTIPWDGLNRLVLNPNVKEVVLLTDGETWTSGSFNGRSGLYADLYANYNATTRRDNPIKINSIALDTQCQYWLGDISAKNGGTCKRV